MLNYYILRSERGALRKHVAIIENHAFEEEPGQYVRHVGHSQARTFPREIYFKYLWLTYLRLDSFAFELNIKVSCYRKAKRNKEEEEE